MAIEPDEAMQAAVDLAKESDVAVVVAGLTAEWEAEGSDRPTCRSNTSPESSSWLMKASRCSGPSCTAARANPKGEV